MRSGHCCAGLLQMDPHELGSCPSSSLPADSVLLWLGTRRVCAKAPKMQVAQPIFVACKNCYTTFIVEKQSKSCATSVIEMQPNSFSVICENFYITLIVKKQSLKPPKVNSYPVYENSPNLGPIQPNSGLCICHRQNVWQKGVFITLGPGRKTVTRL